VSSGTFWTPVFTGVTAEVQFFHTFGGEEGMGYLFDGLIMGHWNSFGA
jgi:hypothetical protein